MSTKLKDKKIIIYEIISERNELGEYIGKYKPIHPGKLWAYVRQLSAKDYFIAGANRNIEEMLFTINWNAAINPYMLIQYKDDWYRIERIDTFEGYKESLHLYASMMSRPGPKDTDILPYE